jgi:hypothetical protein
MRNLLKLTAAGSVLALAASGLGAATLTPGTKVTGFQDLVQKVQKGDEKGPGVRSQDGGGKGAEPGAKGGEPGMGPGKGGPKGAAQQGQREKGAPGEQRQKGAAGEQREKGAQIRSREKGARGGQQRTDIDVDVRGRRDGGTRAGGRTRVDIDVERGRRTGGRDVNIRERGYGYTGGSAGCQEILRRYKQCVGR